MLGIVILPSQGLLSVILNYVASKKLKVTLKETLSQNWYMCVHTYNDIKSVLNFSILRNTYMHVIFIIYC